MTLRRTAPLVLALLAACQTELDRRPLRAVDYAVFDPSNSLIPLPNDLALASAASMPASAQKDLLLAMAAGGGWPNDQEVAITIDVTRGEADPKTGATVYAAPDLDLTTVNAETVVVLKVTATSATPVALDFAATQYVKGETRGTLTLRKAAVNGSRRWDAGGAYVVALRGGADGVKTTDGAGGLQAEPTFYVLREAALASKDLTDPANQGLLPGTTAEKAAAGAQLEPIREGYVSALAAVGQVFDAHDVAVLQTFHVEGGANVPVIADEGVVPLPIDLLRDPTTGKVVNNPAFGAAAAGLATLDGFSTTAMILAPTSAPVRSSTVNATTVQLYKLSGGTATKLTDLAGALGAGTPAAARYVTQPSALSGACGDQLCAPAIGLQPAVPASVPGVGNFFLPPLEEGSDYAVVVTSGVKDATGAALHRSTVAKLLLSVQQPLVANGASTISGVSYEVAAQVSLMKAKLAPVLAQYADPSQVVMAYTFHTQSITSASLQLSAAVYGAANPYIVATAPVTDPTLGAPFLETTIGTIDASDPATGALKPDPATWTVSHVNALVAVPPAAAIAEACPTNPALKCAPLVVFHHGLGGGRWQMAQVANTLLSHGYAVAAIDAPYHGERAFCAQDSDCVVDGGGNGVCTPDQARAGQGDVVPPGTCTTGSLRPTTTGSTEASGNYFVSSNFFRTRDAIRQDLVDQSALVLALARPPNLPLPTGMTDDFAVALATQQGVAIHPGKVYLVGQSLGGIIGTNVVATNPRFSRAVLNVAGGTLVDVFTNAPAFADAVDALFLSLGIDRHDPADAAEYLKTLSVAKWILDPADPINFAAHLKASPLPNLLADQTGATLQSPKAVFGQAAYGDLVVPNPFNALLYQDAGLPWSMYVDGASPATPISHGALLGYAKVQGDIAAFLADPSYYPGATVALP